MITLKCKYCGKEFESKQPAALYCSASCRKVSHQIAAFTKEKPLKSVPGRSSMASQIIQDGDRW